MTYYFTQLCIKIKSSVYLHMCFHYCFRHKLFLANVTFIRLFFRMHGTYVYCKGRPLWKTLFAHVALVRLFFRVCQLMSFEIFTWKTLTTLFTRNVPLITVRGYVGPETFERFSTYVTRACTFFMQSFYVGV